MLYTLGMRYYYYVRIVRSFVCVKGSQSKVRKFRSPTIGGLKMNGSKILFAYRKRLINVRLENSRPHPTDGVVLQGGQIWQIHARGRKIVFTDIDRLQNLMLDELGAEAHNKFLGTSPTPAAWPSP